jgi:hypothetical protein
VLETLVVLGDLAVAVLGLELQGKAMPVVLPPAADTVAEVAEVLVRLVLLQSRLLLMAERVEQE